LQYDRNAPPSDNGFEGDNDPNGSSNEPRSNPTIYNATLCGRNHADARESYGMLVRRGTRVTLGNSIVTGFHAAIDVRDRGTEPLLFGVRFGGNIAQPIAFPELATGTGARADDDFGFDEIASFQRDGANSTRLPEGLDCSDPKQPEFAPHEAIGGVAPPPDDGFFTPVSYVGAVRDTADDWYRTSWARWSER
jgi:hypothetical protein